MACTCWWVFLVPRSQASSLLACFSFCGCRPQAFLVFHRALERHAGDGPCPCTVVIYGLAADVRGVSRIRVLRGQWRVEAAQLNLTPVDAYVPTYVLEGQRMGRGKGEWEGGSEEHVWGEARQGQVGRQGEVRRGDGEARSGEGMGGEGDGRGMVSDRGEGEGKGYIYVWSGLFMDPT